MKNSWLTATRPVFEHFPGWMIAGFYVLALAASLSFFFGFYRRYRTYRQAHPSGIPEGWVRRLASALVEVARSRLLKRRDPVAGTGHALMFSGFVVLFLGTTLLTVNQEILRPLSPSLEFWKGGFYLVYTTTLDIFGFLFLVGLSVMQIRRFVFRPPQLDQSRVDRELTGREALRLAVQDNYLLTILFLIGLTGFGLETTRLAADNPSFGPWSVVGWPLSRVLVAMGLTPPAAASAHMAIWWIHALLALSFIAYLPYSKAVHIVLGLVSLSLRDPLAARRLPRVSAEADHPGAREKRDLPWPALLSFDACTRCGRCHFHCPARQAGSPLSPRDLVQDLKNASLSGSVALAGEVISADRLWACTTCRSCVDRCPVGVEHIPAIVAMRRELVDSGEMDSNLQNTLAKIGRQGNSFGQPERNRARWTKELPFKIPDARKEEVEYLWFVGDYASYDPRSQASSRAIAKVLQGAGVSFGILYEAERNAGNDVRRVGEEGLYESLVEHNLEAMEKGSFTAIVTGDPHSFNTLKHEYPEFGLAKPVLHVTELLVQLIREGRLSLQKLGYRVTFHDPCYLGRYGGVFDAPRQVMEAMGLDLVEMERSREDSFCCGAGGGRIWTGDRLFEVRPADLRVQEAAATGAERMVVTCPKDLAMFSDAVKATGLEDRLQVVDLITLVEEGLAATEAAAAQE